MLLGSYDIMHFFAAYLKLHYSYTIFAARFMIALKIKLKLLLCLCDFLLFYNLILLLPE